MIISIIAAMDKNRLIGKDNRIPWRLPADMRRFRRMTLGKPVVMGRRTFESLGKPLKKRINVVLTRNHDYQAEGCIVVHSIEEVLDVVKDHQEVMICGGAPIYAQFLPRADRLYLTRIHDCFEGDVYFPAFNLDEWQEIERIDYQPDENNPYPYSFLSLQKKD
jgi:dihydrofolate reductase